MRAVVAGRFTPLAEIAEGGMGQVWKARDEETGQLVALKLLRRDLPIDRERFAREGRILASLAHDAIVAHVAHGEDADGLYVAMEWLTGVPLGEKLATDGLTVAETHVVMARVASALAAAHARGILHRDLKPSNIFVPGGDPARTKVIDFGVARHVGEGGILTRPDTAIGTPGYMAPEQACGSADVDARVDMFALGCLGYECLTGRSAFSGQNALALMTKVVLADPTPLAWRCPEAPAALVALVESMLAKSPALRPADGAAALAALSALDGTPLPDARRRPSGSYDEAATRVVVRGPSVFVVAVPPIGTPREELGGELAWVGLADGSLVARVNGADRAARASLALVDRWPGTEIAIVAGGADEHAALDSAAHVAARAGLAAALGKRSQGIWVEPALVPSLLSGFRFAGEEHLIGERT